MSKEKIDLDRITNLLNKKEEPNYSDVDNPKLIDKELFESQKNSVNIDIDDINNTMNFKGNVVGYVNRSTIEKLKDDIISNLGLENIRNCKGFVLQFIVNPNIPYFPDIISEITELISNDCEIIFGTKDNKDLDVDSIEYRILLSGIENRINLE